MADLLKRAQAGVAPAGQRTLVLLTLYGGNDGLGTVVPYADSAYHDARPELAYEPEQIIRLDEQLGLNPAMTGLAQWWQRGNLAVIRGVGYPNPDHSHFRSMDIWQTASPQSPVTTGWIGRWLDYTGDDPVRALNIGSVLPPLAVGEHCTAAALPLGKGLSLPRGLDESVVRLATSDDADCPAARLVREAYRAERTANATFSDALQLSTSEPADHESPAGSGGGTGGLAAQLALVARCVKAGVPTKVYAVSLGGFDTHADERGAQSRQLAAMDDAVSHFLKDVTSHPRGRGVTLLAYSEFGRRVEANASQGTDHGTAGPIFVAGPAVAGGFYGEQPSLRDLDNGDLKVTTDFRGVYAELLRRVLDADPEPILGGTHPTLGFLAA
jgi:uncharacterized protein (DUF1501 family)